MMAKCKYVVNFSPDEGGWWVVTVKGVAGALTQARSISQGRERIREALSLFVDDAETAELEVKVQIGADERREITRARQLQRQTERLQQEATAALRKAARKLATHMSVRDAGEVLGISGARVQQLVQD